MARNPAGRNCRDGGLVALLLVVLAMLRHPVAMWRYVRTGEEPR